MSIRGAERVVAEGWARHAGQFWRRIRRYAVDILLPPAIFLLAAGVYRQVHVTRQATKKEQTWKHIKAAFEADQRGNQKTVLSEMDAASRSAPDDADTLFQLGMGFGKLGQPVRAARHF